MRKLKVLTLLMIISSFLISCETFLVTVREVEKPLIEFKGNLSEEEKQKIIYQVTAKYLNELKTEYDKLKAIIKESDGYIIKVIDLDEKKE